jgi:hypothetical protein
MIGLNGGPIAEAEAVYVAWWTSDLIDGEARQTIPSSVLARTADFLPKLMYRKALVANFALFASTTHA